jgi:hypothetical protein
LLNWFLDVRALRDLFQVSQSIYNCFPQFPISVFISVVETVVSNGGTVDFWRATPVTFCYL